MLFEYFEAVRKRPKEARKRIAFFATVAVMVPIVLLWILSLVAGRPDGTPEVSEPATESTRARFDLKAATREFSKNFGIGVDDPVPAEAPNEPPRQFELENTFVAPTDRPEDSEMLQATTTELQATSTEGVVVGEDDTKEMHVEQPDVAEPSE